eukprot:77688_1
MGSGLIKGHRNSTLHRVMPAAHDKFFIHYVQASQSKPDPHEIQSIRDQRRIVFVDLIGFYKSWENVPFVLLHTALCVLPLKRQWIMEPHKHIQQLRLAFVSKVAPFSDSSAVSRFIRLLQWKQSQGLVLFILDYFDDYGDLVENENGSTLPNPLIPAFWYAVNSKLTSLYDHITESKYQSIHLDEKWWMDKSKYISKYGVKAEMVISELYFVTKKQKVIKEIIYQSNPKSLRPVTVYKDTLVTMRSRQNLRGLRADISPLSPIKEQRSAEEECKYSYRHCVTISK